MKKLLLLALLLLPCVVFSQSTLMGDVDSSGDIDIVDALMIAQYYVGLNPSNFNSDAADVSADGNIDIVDALLIAQCYVGLISCDFGGTTEGNITVRARGTMGGENMEVQVDGVVAGTFTMTTSYQDFSAEGTGVIDVYFTNDDQLQNGMDIQVDYIIYNDTTYQAEDQEENTGVYVNSQCGGSYSDMLQCNGYIRFQTGPTVPPGTATPETPTETPGTETPTPTPGTGCSIPAMPSYSSLPSNAKLPDPFKFMDGSRMTRKDEWACRRAEISALSQEFEFGIKPDKPSSVTGSFSGNSITVTCSNGSTSISFSASISYPSSGSAPYPAMIGIGASSLNNSLLSSLGVATINFPNDDIAAQQSTSSRGQGKFYTLYGSGHSAGALIAWAWGVSRLIDAIETTPSCNIDPARLGVTGCSRNGKGALVAGAFDERIVLTVPQESGSGGAASWRVSDYQKSQGQNVQTLSQIVTENCWFRQNFSQFSSTANKLPFDHHSIEGLCAPRALLVIENTSMEWLGNLSTYTTGAVAHMIWEGLGIPDRMGYSQVGHSDHCGFPSSQNSDLQAFVQKFLVGGGTANTNFIKTDGGFSLDSSRWLDWTVPSLQ